MASTRRCQFSKSRVSPRSWPTRREDATTSTRWPRSASHSAVLVAWWKPTMSTTATVSPSSAPCITSEALGTPSGGAGRQRPGAADDGVPATSKHLLGLQPDTRANLDSGPPNLTGQVADQVAELGSHWDLYRPPSL